MCKLAAVIHTVQVTLPAVLGALGLARSFCLVGDHYQLPPLVQCRAAAAGGLDRSLFRRLCETHPQVRPSIHPSRLSLACMRSIRTCCRICTSWCPVWWVGIHFGKGISMMNSGSGTYWAAPKCCLPLQPLRSMHRLFSEPACPGARGVDSHARKGYHKVCI